MSTDTTKYTSFVRGTTIAAISLFANMAEASTVNFGVLTDIHLQPYYNPTKSSAHGIYCCDPIDKVDEDNGKDDSMDVPAYYGRLGCDPPA